MFTSITVAAIAIAAAVIVQFFLRSDWNSRIVSALDRPRSVENNGRIRSKASSIPASARQLTFKTIGILVAVVVAALAQTPEGLRGSVGKDPRWNSGWIDFAQPTSFYKGDQLRLTVGGTATKVVVRLLDDPRRADSPEGVVGVFTVGAERIVRITLDADYRGIQQISVHGGPNPWNLYDLGGGNGAATLSAAQVIRINRK